MYNQFLKWGIFVECILICLCIGWKGYIEDKTVPVFKVVEEEQKEKETIKWIDFNVSFDALSRAYEWDVKTHGTDFEVDWIELLAYTAVKTGGIFEKQALSILEQAATKLSNGEATIEALTENMKYYDYYKEAYGAVLGGLVGEYQEEVVSESGEKIYQKKYGLKGYFPLARGFEYNHYDDFGAGRTYGYKRKHLGHDMMGRIGTPIIAVESGIVEAIGWNQYGGWRIGIRSFDSKRYYYYAHLRQNYPYAEGLAEGSIVTAGDVIGYMGHTGYSTKENVNNIEVTHLHWGLEIVFDEKRREEGYEIWVDVYPLTQFLRKHTQQTAKVEGTKEWKRTTNIIDPTIPKKE